MKTIFTPVKKLFFVLAGLYFSTYSFSQTANWLWDYDFGGNKVEGVAAMSKDASNNLYLAGTISSASFNFGDIPVSDSFFRTFFIAKTNAAGTVEWVKMGGGLQGSDTLFVSVTANAIATDPAGNSFVVGTFNMDTVLIGGFTLIKPDTASTQTSIFVARYDSAGNVIWAETVGNSSDASSYAIALDVNDNIYITGAFGSDSITFGSTVLTTAPGYGNMFVARLSSSGQPVWASSASGKQLSINSNAIATSPDGGVYVAGYLYSDSISLGAVLLHNPLHAALIFIAKYDTAGNLLWAQAVGNDSSYQYGRAIATDAAANVYLFGTFLGHHITFGNTTLTQYNAGDGGDIFLAKYDANGNALWATSAGGRLDDEAFSVSAGNAGDIYVTGFFQSDTFYIGHDTFSHLGAEGYRVFAAKYDTAGNEQWAKFAWSYENIYSTTVIPDDYGNAYVTGYYAGSYMFLDSNELINNNPSGLGGNIFLAKAGTGATAIIPVEQSFGLAVFPNPSGGQINISGLPVNTAIYLYDVTGRLLLQEESHDAITRVDLAAIAPGIYLLQTTLGSAKIIKM
jgi:hypothetical protein